MSPPPNNPGKVRTARAITFTFSRQLLSGALQFAIVIAVARLLGAEGTGAFTMALLLPQLLSQFLNLGLGAANVYFVASGQFTAQQAWSASRDAMAVLAVAGVVFGVASIAWLRDWLFPGVPASVMLIGLLILPFSLGTSVIVSLFQALQDFRLMNFAILVQPIFAGIGIAALAATEEASLEGILATLVVSYIVAQAYGLVLLSRHVRLLKGVFGDLSYLRPALVYGSKAHLGNILTFLNYRLDLMLVNMIAGTAAAGIYTIAVRIAEQLWIFSQAFATVIFPRLAAMTRGEAERKAFMPLMARAVFWLTFAAAASVAVVAAPAITLLFGTEFVGAFTPLLLLLPGVVLMSSARILAHDLAARGLVGINLRLAAVALVVNTVGNLLAIPPYGIAGAAGATSITYVVLLIAYVGYQVAKYRYAPWTFVGIMPGDLVKVRSLLRRTRGNAGN